MIEIPKPWPVNGIVAPVVCPFEMGAHLARIALSGLCGDDAPACDFNAERAEKGAEGAEWMRTGSGKRSSAARSGFIGRWVQACFQNAYETCLDHEITKVGCLLNFNVSRMKEEVRRMVNGL